MILRRALSLFILIFLPITDVQSSQVHLTLLAHMGKGYVNSIAWSPDGQILAVATSLGIWLYNPNDLAKEPNLLEGFSAQIWFSPDGKQIASNSADSKVTFWDVKSGQVVSTMPGGPIISISPDWSLMHIEDYENNENPLWDLKAGKQIKTLDRLENPHAVRFGPKGQLAAFSNQTNSVQIWDIQHNTVLATMENNSDYEWPADIAFSPDGNILVAGGGTPPTADVSYGKDYVQGWDAHTGKTLFALTDHGKRVSAVGFSPDGKVLASASDDGTIRLRDPQTGQPKFTLLGGNTLAFSPDSKLVATNDRSTGTVRIWKVDTGDQFAAFGVFGTPKFYGSTQPGPVDVQFSPDSSLLATIDNWVNVRVWNSSTFEPLAMLHHPSYVDSVKFSPDSKSIGVVTNYFLNGSSQVHLWNMQRAELLGEVSASSPNIVFGKQHQVLAPANQGLPIVDVQTGAQYANLSESDKNPAYVTTLSPDGTLAATGTENGTIIVWELTSGHVKYIFEGEKENPADGLLTSGAS